MTGPDADEAVRRLAAQSLAHDDPTGWFERLYADAEVGEAVVPWDRGAPQALVARWAQEGDLRGEGERALVVGCGLGRDAEFIARLGFATVAFDVSPTAVRTARDRFPDSSVEYVVADLLDPPDDWAEAFGLVVESMTVQSLPDPPRLDAIVNVGRMVAPRGRLLVVAAAQITVGGTDAGPPWPLTRKEVDAFAASGLETREVQEVVDAQDPAVRRWLAEFRRPATRETAYPGDHDC